MNVKCQCGTRLTVSDDLVGKEVPCPSCQAMITVEAPRTDQIQEVRPAFPSADDFLSFDCPSQPGETRSRPAHDENHQPPFAISGQAIDSLLWGFAGFPLGLPAVLGVILGVRALRDCRRRRLRGRGLAIAGITVSIAAMVFVTVVSLTLIFPKIRASILGSRSVNNLKELSRAIRAFHHEHQHLPPAAVCSKVDGTPLLSWRVLVLPYIGERALYEEFKLDEPWDGPHNIKLLPRMPKVFAPVGATTDEPYVTYYQVFVGPGTPLNPIPAANAPFGAGCKYSLGNMPDGHSDTIGVIEAGDPVPWTKPAELVYDPLKPLPKLGGVIPGRVHVGMMDGSVWPISPSINERTIRNAIVCDDDYSEPWSENWRPVEDSPGAIRTSAARPCEVHNFKPRG